MANKPIFFDASGRRAARVSLIGWIAAVIAVLVGTAFAASLIIVPHVDGLTLPGRLTAIHIPELERNALAPGLLRSAAHLAIEARAKREDIAREHRLRTARGEQTHVLSAMLRPQAGRPLSIGFYPSWRDAQDSAYDALKLALPQLDWVVPTWLNLAGPDQILTTSYEARVKNYVRRTKPSAAILTVIQNVANNVWEGPGLAKLLADEKRRTALVGAITTFVSVQKLQGIVVDFEQVPASAQGNLGTFLKQLTVAFKPHGWIVVVCAPLDDDTWPFAAYARIADYSMLMSYDEHDDTGPAGSIAGQSWYENTLDKRMRALNPARTIIALGGYAYDWNGGHADDLSFEDAVVAAHDSEADIDFDDATNNPHFSYIEEDNTKHDVWLLDGATAYNEIHAADAYQPAGYALWRLGTEDPSVWTVMGRPYGTLPPDSLRNIPIGEDIDFEGQGEILTVEAQPSAGARSIELDKQTGDIDDETYTKLPTSYVIRQYGAVQKKIALTFDDGPDPEWTPQILDILKEKHVKATFFIIGANAEANPGIVEREIDEGHEIGNHTFTHPNLADTPPDVVRLELSATERLFEALTGRSMRLFRPPYLGDAEPTDEDEIIPVEIAQSLGYTTVGEHIDPVDWALPGVPAIIKASLDAVHNPNPDLHGSILLLHDAGGDRAQTVAALPLLIDKLRAQGYQFVLVSDLAGLTRAQAMPPLSPTIALLTDRVVFLTLSAVGHTLYYCFLAAIWLGIGRLLFLVVFALRNQPKERDEAAPPIEALPFLVSVIVPAYNEERVIATTISGLLTSAYANIEIIVVDDGSQDDTAGVVAGNSATMRA